MARGRKPKPTHLKVVTGNPGRRPLNDKEPQVNGSRPSAPSHMSDKGKETWGYVSGILDRMGVLTEVDAIALEVLCEAYADFIAARKALADFGSEYYFTLTAQGDKMHRAHPAVAQKNDADRRIRGWMAEFGMTPSARSRVQGDPKDRDEELAEKYFG